MGPIGFTEMALIFVVALLVFGPNKLPELARNLGKSLAEFRRASNDLRRSIMEADTIEPAPKPPQGPADEVAAGAPPASPPGLPHSVPAAPPIAEPVSAAPQAEPSSAKPNAPTS
ncbi:MAG TPA: twin-arginine translocase TatA/TatE family subunit [Myxococcota bacterium]